MKTFVVVLSDQTVTVRADGFHFTPKGYLFLRAGEPCGFFHKDSVHGFYESDGTEPPPEPPGDDECPPSAAPVPNSTARCG